MTDSRDSNQKQWESGYKSGYKRILAELRRTFNKLNHKRYSKDDKWLKLECWIIEKEKIKRNYTYGS